MEKPSYKSNYESVRNAHISENKARMEMLGLSRTKEELNMMIPPPTRRPYTCKQYATGPPRRSSRLNRLAVQHKALPLKGCLGKATPMLVDEDDDSDALAVVGGEPAPQAIMNLFMGKPPSEISKDPGWLAEGGELKVVSGSG